jgi:hypothetical protein
MAEWLEALGRIALLAKEPVAPLLISMAALVIGCHPANGAAAAPPAGPAWAWNLPVYETALDLATPHGAFREFEQRLDPLQARLLQSGRCLTMNLARMLGFSCT